MSELAQLCERLDRIEGMLRRVVIQPTGERLSTKQAMQRLGYKSLPKFLETVKAQGIPYLRINARHFVFEADALDAWMAQRRIAPKTARTTRRAAA